MAYSNPLAPLLGMFTPQQPDAYQSLLGDYYDPKRAAMSWLGGNLQGIGMGLASGKPGAWATGGLQGGQQGIDDYQRQALAGYGLNMRKQEYDYQQQQRQEEAAAQKAEADAQAAAISGLPPEMQSMAKAFPSAVIPSYVKNKYFPDPTAPIEPKRYNVGGSLVDANGNVIYQDQTAQGGISADVEQRKQAASQMGLSPDDPAYKSFVLTGKMPREDQAPLTATDKKAILEADEAVQSNQQIIDLLSSVITPDKSGKSLNDKAGYGVGADWQSFAARNDPTGFFNDSTGQATTELNNIVLNNALSSLKTIFGGNPTEGERSILLDLQASVSKSPQERKPIIERAIAAANRRLSFNKQRAEAMRGGSYYKNGGSSVAGPSVDDLVKQYTK